MDAKDRLLVALDLPSPDAAVRLALKLWNKVGGYKIGKRMFVLGGPQVVNSVGVDRVFLDLKFHDIPNTVAGAVEAAAQLGVMMCNVHCEGGPKMMRAAREAADKYRKEHGRHGPLLIGVTILTSHNRESLDAIGLRPGATIEEIVGDLALMAKDNGLNGVVCSPREIEVVRKRCGDNFVIVTPGIRKSTDPPDDQMRTATAREALDMGASYIVVGRPIIGQADPVAAAEAMIADMETSQV
jgi:orotidine-5'-phosphate decarboxylase